MDEDRVRDRELAEVDLAEARKPASRILEQLVEEGKGEIERRNRNLLITGFEAGLEVGLGVFMMAVTLTYADNILPKPIVEFFLAHMYTIGFIFVILGRSELFTEHTTIAVLPVLNRKANLAELARLWAVIYIANLAGTAVFAIIAALTGPGLGIVDPPAFGQLAHRMVDHSWWVIFLSAILAGWMMGLLAWMVTAARDTISQVAVIWLVTSAIGFSGLHHVISGSVEVLVGLFAHQGITWWDYGYFLLWATLGNSIGGAIFVAALKNSYVMEEKERKADKRETKPGKELLP